MATALFPTVFTSWISFNLEVIEVEENLVVGPGVDEPVAHQRSVASKRRKGTLFSWSYETIYVCKSLLGISDAKNIYLFKNLDNIVHYIVDLTLFSVELIKSLTKKLKIGMASQMLKLYLNKAKQNMILNHRRSEP